MQCEQFEQILEQQDVGPLPKPALAHVDECDACRSLMADLGEISEIAKAMGDEGIAPPERVWIALRNQMEAEGIFRESQQAPRSVRQGWWSAFQRPAFAGAFLGLILVGAAAISYLQNTSQVAVQSQLAAAPQETSVVPSADSIFKEEVLSVGNDSIPGFQGQDEAVTASFHRNLGIVDNFIAMCEKDVREQPDNQMAREYLYGAYEQKAELLATATSRSLTGGLQ